MDNIKPSQIVLMAAGAVLLVFSLFAFLTFDISDADRAFLDRLSPSERAEMEAEFGAFPGSDSLNAWSGDNPLAPLAGFTGLLGLAVAVAVALGAFASVKLPDRVLTFTMPQLYFAAGFASFFVLFGALVMGTGDGTSWGFGFWLMLLGSVGLVAGAVMELTQGEGATTSSSGAPPAPF